MEKLSYNNKREIVIFDLETENLNLIAGKPWQIAWTRMKNGKVLDTQERYIFFEDLRVSKQAAIVTRFDYNYYKSRARPAEEVWEEFAPILYDSEVYLSGHNLASFDLPVMQTWGKLVGKWKGWADIYDRVIDTLLLGRIFNRNEVPDMENFLSCQLKEVGKPPKGSKKCKLSDLAGYLGIEVENTRLHGALYDIELNAKVLNALIYKMNL